MAANIALRIRRPYSSEEAFLDAESSTFSKREVSLLGQERHPVGATVRFELSLEGGERLFRGEGEVARFEDEGSEGKLVVRLKRMDKPSKDFLLRAVAHTPASDALTSGIQESLEPSLSVINDTQDAEPTQAADQDTDSTPPASSAKTKQAVPAPQNRAELLARLRKRAGGLAKTAVVAEPTAAAER